MVHSLILFSHQDALLSMPILTLRRLMSYIYGAPILDVSRSHTTCDLETSRMGAPYKYDISSLKVNNLTLILLMWRKW